MFLRLAKFLGTIVSPITKTVETVSNNRVALKKRQIDRVVNAEDKMAVWEQIHAENSKTTWLVDFFSILLSVPLIGSFIPAFVPHIHAGFAALELMPEAYQYWLAVAILSTFGVRAIKK